MAEDSVSKDDEIISFMQYVFNIRSEKQMYQKVFVFFKLRVLEILFKHDFNNKQGLSQSFIDDKVGVVKKCAGIFLLTKCQENTKHTVTIQILTDYYLK